jgi:hypothetical protein
MLTRFVILSAFGLLAFVSIAQSQQPSPSPGRGEGAPQQQEPTGVQQQPAVAAQNANEKITSADEKSKQQAAYDWWLWYSGLGIGDKIAIIATFVGFLQFIALFATVRAMKSSARRQLRAYVTHEIKAWRGINDGRPLAVQVALITYGQTPARAVKILGIIDIIPFPLPAGYRLPALWTEIPQSVNVFPGETRNPAVGWITAKRSFTAAEITEITSEKSKRRAYMLGRISYRDVFNKRRVTTFRAFLDPKSVQRDAAGEIATFIWAATERGNDFR